MKYWLEIINFKKDLTQFSIRKHFIKRNTKYATALCKLQENNDTIALRFELKLAVIINGYLLCINIKILICKKENVKIDFSA